MKPILALLALPLVAAAAPPEPVVVTAHRLPGAAPVFDAPLSIDLLDGERVREHRLEVNLSEALAAVPGVAARDRQNFAQDLQVSMRGFGARASFGLRGVRVLVDGIPATLPDGQGQITNVDLASLASLEVLRGPFSALYGNASGGVIVARTRDGAGPPRATAAVAVGSDGMHRESAGVAGGAGTVGYVTSASRFATDGHRAHAAATRDIANLKLIWAQAAGRKLTLVANGVRLPSAQDPLGLTRAQWQADPRGVTPEALQFDTRKSVAQSQGGAAYEHAFAAGTLALSAYAGHRSTEQYQSIPVAAQQAASSAGGVIALSRGYRGADLRYTWPAGAGVTLVAGAALDRLDEDRRGHQNFIGTRLGVKGALRRAEDNRVQNRDAYAQAALTLAPAWTLDAGVRTTTIAFDSRDRYIAPGNPDDSGRARYTATLPVAALGWRPREDLRLHLTAGRGVETPTLNELSYRASGASGLNLALRPAESRNVELGAKARGAWGTATVALFRVDTADEIVTASNSGGRSTFQNAGGTRREGIELSHFKAMGGDWEWQAAWTWLDARYRDAFRTCAGTPCAAPNLTIPAGNRMPGTAAVTGYAALARRPAAGLRYGIEAQHVSAVWVDDRNSDRAPAYTLANLHAGHAWRWAGFTLEAFVRVDNAFDRRHAGSVIVNEGNGRFFEPGRGRTWLAGVTLR